MDDDLTDSEYVSRLTAHLDAVAARYAHQPVSMPKPGDVISLGTVVDVQDGVIWVDLETPSQAAERILRDAD
jgi:uncharacterized protein YraI